MTKDEYLARATVQKAREILNVIEMNENNETKSLEEEQIKLNQLKQKNNERENKVISKRLE